MIQESLSQTRNKYSFELVAIVEVLLIIGLEQLPENKRNILFGQ